ncbi:hypothetical protein BDW75DRAFT_23226 [Aspergillus navahoensis]
MLNTSSYLLHALCLLRSLHPTDAVRQEFVARRPIPTMLSASLCHYPMVYIKNIHHPGHCSRYILLSSLEIVQLHHGIYPRLLLEQHL